MSEEPNLQEIHDVLVEISKRAGQMITSARPSMGNMDTKKNSADLVTETDQAVEAMVSSTLKARYPDYDFMGEETYTPGATVTDAPTFICDPIDGTTNFVHGYPYVSISLGFAHHLRPLVGVVYNPFTGNLYTAVRGQGAYLTTAVPAAASPAIGGATELKRRLPLRNTSSNTKLTLDKALVCIEWGSERSGPNWGVKLATFAALAGGKEGGGAMVHSLRSLGSAALNMCAVAAGEMDAYWEGGCWAWDVAAGWIILEESGGHVFGANDGEWEVGLDARRYLAVRAVDEEEQRGGEITQASVLDAETKAFVKEFWGCVKGRLEY